MKKVNPSYKNNFFENTDDRPISDGEENLFSDPLERSPYENILKKNKKPSFDEKNQDFG